MQRTAKDRKPTAIKLALQRETIRTLGVSELMTLRGGGTACADQSLLISSCSSLINGETHPPSK
jgi:hypothetical protein